MSVEELHEVMSQEVNVLREVLGTMEQEQLELMACNEVGAKVIADYRTSLVGKMRFLREKMSQEIEGCDDLEEDCFFLALKEQIISLGRKIAAQKLQNRVAKRLGFTPIQEIAKPKLCLQTIDLCQSMRIGPNSEGKGLFFPKDRA